MYSIVCHRCQRKIDEASYQPACLNCGGPLHFEYPGYLSPKERTGKSMWIYRDLLPVRSATRIISLDEGGTPLLKARFSEQADVYIKNETLNPTGSHKDRALSIGMTKAVEFGRDAVMLYSDGSTALSSAAYAARAGLKSITVIGRGTPEYSLLPLMVYNSHLLEYQGTAAEALNWVHKACQTLGIYETSTYRLANPYQAEGAKTIGLEIFEQLGRPPEWVVVPVGGGGTLAGIWQAFVELQTRGLISRKPRMAGVLPEGFTMLEMALARGLQSDRELRGLAPLEAPPTRQVKIAMTYSPDGLEAIAAVRDSDGLFLYASDHEALAAQKKLGARDGIYAELSAAVAVVGAEKLLSAHQVHQRETVVVVVTGFGFREKGALSDQLTLTKTPVDASSGIAVLKEILRNKRVRWT
ncbi:MAG: pyridoxal-phosphate dependent enzyme [Verrucomicrobiales bacterium]|nr:pyridoxal-phosphate dependent enzyme [Verrucomicrobiales bacterium]